MYSQIVNDIITYLETHISEDLDLDDYAVEIGYSKFYLTRQFKKETGTSIGEYVRNRKLSLAASDLIHTNEPIIDIAVKYHFQSQEAFSRSFKDLYKLPPGKYRNTMRSLLIIEDDYEENDVKGWFLSGSHPEHFEIKTDSKVFHSGNQSGYLGATHENSDEMFGTLMQQFQAEHYKGKRIRVSCYLKSKDATRAAIWTRIDNIENRVLQFDNMQNRQVTGTKDWNYYQNVLDVPTDSAVINFGVLLYGNGCVWVDGFKVEEVDEAIETTTETHHIHLLPLEPTNLGFDEL